ncbi:MAG: tRNA uridine(34) 5-carboxymethylaminomethyl modification radical SAM/GNAT enzyme Elp3, partial [Patescibacteria group bacterium]
MREAIIDLLKNWHKQVKTRDDLSEAKRRISTKYKISSLLNSQILDVYRELTDKGQLPRGFDKNLWDFLLRKRSIRTLSGIAPVAVLTKPYPCPGNCAYCPNIPNVPVSYLPNEPAVMRALACSFDPYKQTVLRLNSLENNGHRPNKIELIVIGGTWSYLPDRYQYWYILNCFRAANDFAKLQQDKTIKSQLESADNSKAQILKSILGKLKTPYPKNLSLADLKKSLKAEQTKNEKTEYKIIGITLETRPDYINEKELWQMRELGCTRVEIGVQAPDDEILKLNKRGHNVAEIARATAELRDFGFKVTYHIMPALPGSTPKRDLEMFKMLFTDERFQPDQIKFYPTVVTEGSLLYRWWKAGKYQPYSDEELEQLIIDCKAVVPKYVRIIRLIRDIPGESILAGNKITNLRQVMQQKGVKCNCIRCRESKEISYVKDFKINIEEYAAADGIEYFISADSSDDKTLYGF